MRDANTPSFVSWAWPSLRVFSAEGRHFAVQGDEAAVDLREEVVQLFRGGGPEILSPVDQGEDPEKLEIADIQSVEKFLQRVELRQILAALVLGELALADAR